MRVGLNLLHALPEIGGGWTYISNVLASLAHFDQDNEYTVFVNRLSRSLAPKATNFSIDLSPIEARSRAQRILYENTILPLKARRLHLDCLHWFANTQALWSSVPGLVTVYDLQAFRSPSPFPLHKR